jgi:hypothetical protein
MNAIIRLKEKKTGRVAYYKASDVNRWSEDKKSEFVYVNSLGKEVEIVSKTKPASNSVNVQSSIAEEVPMPATATPTTQVVEAADKPSALFEPKQIFEQSETAYVVVETEEPVSTVEDDKEEKTDLLDFEEEGKKKRKRKNQPVE